MSRVRVATALLMGLGSCFTIGLAYGVCVTPQQLKGKTVEVAALPAATFTFESDFVNTVLNGKTGTVSPLSADVARSLAANVPNIGTAMAPDLPAAVLKLSAMGSGWQPINPAPLTMPMPSATEIMTLQKNLEKVQKWATFGELVIAIDAASGHIAILVPDDRTPTEKWSIAGTDYLAPHIAYSAAGGGTKSADASMKVLFTDPTKIAFFRYSN